MHGLGYVEYRRLRMVNEGLRASDVEKAGNERYAIYFGRSHVTDHETNFLARGPLKIGRAKFVTALMRGRNQPGIDFRVYAEIILDSNAATHDVEEAVARLLIDHRMEMGQNQQECYDISDSNLLDWLPRIIDAARNTGHNICETKIYIPH